MQPNDKVTLSRDVEAVVVPMGAPATLEKGEEVMITQTLGGTYTVICSGNMYRIEGANADALGLESVSDTVRPREDQAPVTHEDIVRCAWDQMKGVYDPEIPVNIVDLGLVYGCEIGPLEDGGGYRANIKMTLTAPGCGMGDHLRMDVQRRVLAIEGVEEADVELVWEPQWSQEMMSEEAKLTLGMI